MKKKIINIISIFVIPIALFLLFMIIAKGFGLHSAPIIISQSMIPLVIGLAMATLMGVGLLDFSPGARVVFAAILGGWLSQSFGAAGLIIGCLIGGIFGGLVIGFLYTLLKIPSMVISLGVVLIFEIFGAKLAGSSGMLKITNELSQIGSFPYNILFALLAGTIFYYIYYMTKTGCEIQSVGNDEKLALSLGVKANRVKFYAFLISGIFCGIGAIMQMSYAATISVQISMSTLSMVFKPMMGVLIGLQLVRYVNNLPLLIFIGEITIAIIFNGFIALGLTATIQNIVLGVFLLSVMAISENSNRLNGKKQVESAIENK